MQTMIYCKTTDNQYLGTWKCVGDIGHPDGMMSRVGDTIIFTEKGVDCRDLFGYETSWSMIEDLVYYDKDGTDYFVDPNGEPVGFKYEPENNQIVLYSPSTNNPSDDPYYWNSRMRFERK